MHTNKSPRNIQIILAAVFTAFLSIAVAKTDTAAPAAPDDHEQLRALLAKTKTAINSGHFEDLNDLFYNKFSATLVDQDLITTREQLQTYFNKWFKGDKAFIKKITMDPVADDKTEIYDGKYGVAHGTSNETYELVGGKNYTIKARWTATVIKDGGQWKILALHSGVNLIDNPILNAAEKSLYYFAGGGAIIGLIIGFLLGRRRKS